MFLLTRDEQIHFRILISIVLICGILYIMFFNTNKVSIKKIAVEGENQLTISLNSNNEIKIEKITQTGKTALNRTVINTASYEDLLNCPGIGSKKAKQIIKEREIAPFIDWRDLQDRIKGISLTQVEILKDAGVMLNASESNNDL